MTDKEPRKRRKRKDASRKDDAIHTESQPQSLFHLRDSDQDQEEEAAAPVPIHEPSKVAQTIFIVLSLILLVAVSSVFIALRGSQVDRGLSDDDDVHFMDSLNILSEPSGLPDVQLNDDVEMIVDDYGLESSIFGGSYEDQVEMEPNESTLDHSSNLLEDEDDMEEEIQPLQAEESELEEEDLIENDLNSQVSYLTIPDDIEPISLPSEAVQPTPDIHLGNAEEPAPDTDMGEQDFIEHTDVQQEDFTQSETVNAVDESTDDMELVEDPLLPESTDPILEPPDVIMTSTLSSLIPNEEDDDQEELQKEDQAEELHEKHKAEELYEKQKAEELDKKHQAEELHKKQQAEELHKKQQAEELHKKQQAEELHRKQEAEELYEKQKAEELHKKQQAEELHKKQHAEEGQKADIDHTEEESSDEPEDKPIKVNRADEEVNKQLGDADNVVEKNPEKALKSYEAFLQGHPSNHKALYGKARALDRIAELQRSNKHLEEAIKTYRLVMAQTNVSDELYLLAGERCAERMQFRGFVGKSLKVLLEMSERFPEKVDIKNQIAVRYLMIGQNAQAKKAFRDIIQDYPNNGFAKVHLGFILKTDDSNYKEAIPLMTEGIASQETGVIDGRFYFHLGDALARVGKSDEAMKVYEDGVEKNLFASVYQRSLYNVAGLTAKPWWSTAENKYSAYLERLESNWLDIKAEALALAGNLKFSPESEGLQDGGEWEQFELFVRGKRISKNCAAVPLTCSLIEQMPDAATCKRGQVKFSIMKPGTHVWAHTGPTNCRLRAHLGLVIPKGVRLRVANETRTWENGKVLLFDDSFEHEVWHEGTSSRLVLIVDFWHPELSMQQRASLSPI